MNIREDFKFNPESWENEAKVLMKRSMAMILTLSILIPFGIYFATDKLAELIYSMLGANAISALLMSAIETSPFVLLYASGFYMLFFYKRVDFGEKTNVFNMISDINKTFKSYVQLLKENKGFILVMWAVAFIFYFFVSNALIKSGKIEETMFDQNIVKGLLYSVGWFGLFLFLSLNSLKHSLMGIVYIGYKMVNPEGARILTIQAYSKYPDLEKYMVANISKVSMLLWISIIAKVMLFTILKDPNVQNVVAIIMNYLFAIYGMYIAAIAYLASRDLYGGSPKKVTEEVKIENENVVPQT